MAEFLSQDEIDALLDIADGVDGVTQTDYERVIDFLNKTDYMFEVAEPIKYLKRATDDFCLSTLDAHNTKIEEMIRLSEVCYVMDGLIKTYNINFEDAVKFHRSKGYLTHYMDEINAVDRNHNIQEMSLSKSIREVVPQLKGLKV